MKANIICPECGFDQEIDINPGGFWEAKCPNCNSIHRAIEIKKEIPDKSTQNILTEASAIINGERLDTYGKPEDSFKIIARFWKIYLAARPKLPESLNALDVAHMMTLFKLARLLGQKPERDNYRDACGYLAIAADRLSSDRSS
jgi:phage FluMu protein Com